MPIFEKLTEKIKKHVINRLFVSLYKARRKPKKGGITMRNKTIKQKMLCSLLLIALMLTCALPVSAAVPEEVVPLWENITDFYPTLMFYNNIGYLTVNIRGGSGTSNISASAHLYYKNAGGNWVEISQNWDYCVNESKLVISESFSAISGIEYKVEVEVRITVGNSTETANRIVSAIC